MAECQTSHMMGKPNMSNPGDLKYIQTIAYRKLFFGFGCCMGDCYVPWWETIHALSFAWGRIMRRYSDKLGTSLSLYTSTLLPNLTGGSPCYYVRIDLLPSFRAI